MDHLIDIVLIVLEIYLDICSVCACRSAYHIIEDEAIGLCRGLYYSSALLVDIVMKTLAQKSDLLCFIVLPKST